MSLLAALLLAVAVAPQPATVTVVGDSLASGLAPAIVVEARERGIVATDRARVGCPITDAPRLADVGRAPLLACAASTPAHRSRLPASDVTVIISSWENGDFEVGGQRLAYRSPEWDQWMTDQVLAYPGRMIVVATIPPRQPLLGRATMLDHEVDETLRLGEFHRTLSAGWFPRVGIVDLERIVCPAMPCPEFMDGLRLRPDDGGHFSAAGAEWVAPRLMDAILAEWDRATSLWAAPDGLF